MPNSKSHSSYYFLDVLNKYAALYAGGESKKSKSYNADPPKTYVIKGPDVTLDQTIPQDVIMHGNGTDYVNLKKLAIAENARVILYGHGDFSLGKHTIGLEENFGYTQYALQSLASASDNTPLNIEVFSCHGGYAINDIGHLPKGSSLMTFIDDKNMTFSSTVGLLLDASFTFDNQDNQFARFASYLLLNPHVTKFAVKGSVGNHFFFNDPETRQNYTNQGIRLWQKELIQEYISFLENIKQDMDLVNIAKIDQFIELTNSQQKLDSFISTTYKNIFKANHVIVPKPGYFMVRNHHETYWRATVEGDLDQFIDEIYTEKYKTEYLFSKTMNNDIEAVKALIEKGVDTGASYNVSWSMWPQPPSLERLEEAINSDSSFFNERDHRKMFDVLAEQKNTKAVNNNTYNIETLAGLKSFLARGCADKDTLQIMRRSMYSQLKNEVALYSRNPTEYIRSHNNTNEEKEVALKRYYKSQYSSLDYSNHVR